MPGGDTGRRSEAEGAMFATVKKDIVIGHNKNWLELNRSKMAEDLASNGR